MYCSTNSIINAIGKSELIKLVNDSAIRMSDINVDDINSEAGQIIGSAIKNAEAEIDSYLVRNVSDNPPVRLIQIATDIASFYLYKRRLETIPDVVVETYKIRLKELAQIRDGKLFVAGYSDFQPEESIPGTANTAQVRVSTDKIFGSDFIKRF